MAILCLSSVDFRRHRRGGAPRPSSCIAPQLRRLRLDATQAAGDPRFAVFFRNSCGFSTPTLHPAFEKTDICIAEPAAPFARRFSGIESAAQ
jgi:hypothetical protein